MYPLTQLYHGRKQESAVLGAFQCKNVVGNKLYLYL